MSGTSLDGIDAALVAIDAASIQTLGLVSAPLPEGLRAELAALQASGPDELHRAHLAANDLARAYASAVASLLEQTGHTPAEIVALGAHGQTVRHRPELGYTTQLLNGALLAEVSHIDVVCDLRSADVASGGQGAPLVPAFHALTFGHVARRRVIVNIGGIANVTVLTPGQPPSGFDTGPGNVLMDLWIERHRGGRFDADGRWAASGRPDPSLLHQLLSEPWFARPAPKSTGRDLFHAHWLDERLGQRGMSLPPCDVQATLLALTVQTIAHACHDVDAEEVFVCGGGAANGALMQALAQALPEVPVQPTEALGVAAQAVEACAFAWLACRRLDGEPGNLVEVTGARRLRILGAHHAHG